MSTKTPIIKGLYPILDTSIVPIPKIKETASEIIKGGCQLLQFRAEGLSTKEFLNISLSLRDITDKEGIAFIINNRVDIAMIANADGVHIGQRDLPCKEVRKLLGREKIVGVSTHNKEEAHKAEADGADYIAFGPIYLTATKKDADKPKGLERLKDIKAFVTIPVVAIGGINEKHIREVMETGVDSVAMISDILTADDISGKVERLESIIDDVGI
jgi:thiamine-phosphate pyrophosphorylase